MGQDEAEEQVSDQHVEPEKKIERLGLQLSGGDFDRSGESEELRRGVWPRVTASRDARHIVGIFTIRVS